MNKRILDSEVQNYINSHLAADVHKIAMAKSPFTDVSAGELANQIAAKNKCVKKLPAWFSHKDIYYPPLLSIEQCSSEITAQYKSGLAKGDKLIDLTGGFGVDSYYFAKGMTSVTHCEISEELSEIAAHNAKVLAQGNIKFIASNGLKYLQATDETFDTIYIDPARRSTTGKVFMLKDCTPDVVSNLDLMLSKTRQIIIKTAPLLDITAGLKELHNVSEIHIVSVRNECKELLWLIDKDKPATQELKITAVTLNETIKEFSFYKEEADEPAPLAETGLGAYLYEPDAALLKSGAFSLIAIKYKLKKLHSQTQLYTSAVVNADFPGRIFKISAVISTAELKKQKDQVGNVIVRNYPDKVENLAKKYKIKPDNQKFLIFTQSKAEGNIIIQAEILQHY